MLTLIPQSSKRKLKFCQSKNIFGVIFKCVKIFQNNFCLAASKTQAKISSEDCVQGGGVTHPPSKKKGARNIRHSMSMVLDTKKSNFRNQQYLQFYIWFIMTLHYKMQQALLQNMTAVLLQNAKKFYYKMCQVFYYKLRK